VVRALGDGTTPVALAPLAAARKALVAGDRLSDLVRAIRGEPDHEFRSAAFSPPTVESVLRALAADFDAALKAHRSESERQRLAARLKAVFGDRELITFPTYNEQTDARLLAKKLPGLPYAGALVVLDNFREFYHRSLYQKFFQAFQMEADFVGPDPKSEFQAHRDGYFSMVETLERFAEDLRSPATSSLAPVLAALEAPFLDARTKQALKKPLDEVNHRADQVIQEAYQTVKRLHHLLEKYLIDLDDPSPQCFSGGAVLRSKHPELVRLMEAGAKGFRELSGILRQMVFDKEQP
jgi:hypothetical protein